jgi:hypothetical protein
MGRRVGDGGVAACVGDGGSAARALAAGVARRRDDRADRWGGRPAADADTTWFLVVEIDNQAAANWSSWPGLTPAWSRRQWSLRGGDRCSDMVADLDAGRRRCLMRRLASICAT